MANFPFKNSPVVGKPLISDILESNLAAYYNWNLLNTAAFVNVHYNTSGSYGGSAARLRLANHPNYSAGRVWEGFRKQWVWQSGIHNSTQPINISGVKVNGNFYASSTTGAYAHKIDYSNGRVIFNNPIATNSTVLVEHSFNYFQVYTADNPWWQEIHRNSFRVDDTSFLMSSSGVWAKPPEQRVQLPCFVVEASPNIHKTGFELGSQMSVHRQDIRVHILTETRQDMKWAVDIVTGEFDTIINLFDKATMIQSGVYPLNMSDGSLSSSMGNYPDFLTNYPLRKEAQFKETRAFDNNQYIMDVQDKKTIPFYFSTVRINMETLV